MHALALRYCAVPQAESAVAQHSEARAAHAEDELLRVCAAVDALDRQLEVLGQAWSWTRIYAHRRLAATDVTAAGAAYLAFHGLLGSTLCLMGSSDQHHVKLNQLHN
jgi:hypothetical protein